MAVLKNKYSWIKTEADLVEYIQKIERRSSQNNFLFFFIILLFNLLATTFIYHLIY